MSVPPLRIRMRHRPRTTRRPSRSCATTATAARPVPATRVDAGRVTAAARATRTSSRTAPTRVRSRARTPAMPGPPWCRAQQACHPDARASAERHRMRTAQRRPSNQPPPRTTQPPADHDRLWTNRPSRPPPPPRCPHSWLPRLRLRRRCRLGPRTRPYSSRTTTTSSSRFCLSARQATCCDSSARRRSASARRRSETTSRGSESPRRTNGEGRTTALLLLVLHPLPLPRRSTPRRNRARTSR